MKPRFTRRQFILLLAIAAGQAMLARFNRLLSGRHAAANPVETNNGLPHYLPLIQRPSPTASPTATPAPAATQTATATATPTPTPPPTSLAGRVVHVHAGGATFWNGEAQYWNYVDQTIVDDMMDSGVMALTDATTTASAWRRLLPGYQPGQKVAIKVSFNNVSNIDACSSTGNKIDGLIEIVNAVVRGLLSLGAAEADVWVFDAKRRLPDRFVARSRYAGVRYFDADGFGCREPATYHSQDAEAYITFHHPGGQSLPPERLADVVIQADYLINIPIMKFHSPQVGVSLGFKNHFGTVDSPGALHPYLDPSAAEYRTDYSPLVDIFRNRHIGPKTVLTIGDGLFGAIWFNAAPTPWTTFGDRPPNSLFLAADPVSVDCVMHDFVAAEYPALSSEANRYLRLAGGAGLGLFEQGAPWGSGYRQIDYRRLEG